MTIRLFAKRWLLFTVMVISILSVVQYIRHRPISREDLIALLLVGVWVAAFPGENKSAKRLGFRLGQKLREYGRRDAES